MNKKDRQKLASIVRALDVLSQRLAIAAPTVALHGSVIEQMSVSEFAKYLSNQIAKLLEE
jgi:phage replication-related protein YjqB (UPF0714/DUF867 family)